MPVSSEMGTRVHHGLLIQRGIGMKLGRWGGINVYIHWTFWILIAFYLITVSQQSGPVAGIVAAAFVMSVFACVALHEFGHAGAAAYFGIRTLDITLLPIGGMARLERLPEKPYQELVVALAGPAVNFVIAAGLLPIVMLVAVSTPGSATEIFSLGFAQQLLVANLILAVFNLLPAFPMDGGRVLRSLLAMRMGHLRATEVAARVGRWMALFLGVLGIFYSWMLVLLAVFIFVAGTAELLAARVRAMGQGFGAQGFETQTTPQSTGFRGWQTTGWPPGSGSSWSQSNTSAWDQSDDIIEGEVIDVQEIPPRIGDATHRDAS